MTDIGRISFQDIGARLRAHRIGRGLGPEELALRIGISRAALYRAEKGEITKIETLASISRELNVSLPTLLGVGIEYIPNALAYFERMRQVEEDADQIIGLFSPISYLVTTQHYDAILRDVFAESVPQDRQAEARRILDVLSQRKQKFMRRRPLLASIISTAEIESFLRDGLEGRHGLPDDLRAARRRAAAGEVRHIIGLLREPDIGIQLGVSPEPFPSTSFQITRSGERSTLTVSPFRLGHNPNIAVGVGFVTSAPEAVELHDGIARILWERSLRGPAAADHLEDLIEQAGESGISA
ncbi:helix-turn-helix domain-containing protein [Roseicitreum antarcticum]|uniref:Transcriptional regulator, contains XRE-family HTH domain n=1 Tax=Roseicitreum antarcticum TaxID=564137 RepID=A0A1H2YQ54_9RHOB|nr:helix-turn-helix transcriptional regulator [Roseicitreum antarcticum]SDX07342.1 Transcriptional regulator, contains XRE-family HTH domain [Roseicitreum antarcticum]